MIDLFCIASGPSLTYDDCELIRKSGIKSVAVNNSWEMAPFCNYIYAGDRKWWAAYHDKITINAERWTCSDKAASSYGLNYHIAGGPYNSGMRAIQFAISKGFKSIALIGYDCSVKKGTHWHGDHKIKGFGNPTNEKISTWKDQFKRVSDQAKKNNITVINCSRYTELECFDIVKLEKALGYINE